MSPNIYDLCSAIHVNRDYIERMFEAVRLKPVLPYRLMILGHGRSGKDTIAQMFANALGYHYGGSTSLGVKPIITYSITQSLDPVVNDQCYDDRHTYRQYWFDACNMLRRIDPLIIIKCQLAIGDFMLGNRSKEEFINGLDYWRPTSVIWMARRVAPVDPTLEFTRSDITIECNKRSIHHITMGNNDSLDVLRQQVDNALRFLPTSALSRSHE